MIRSKMKKELIEKIEGLCKDLERQHFEDFPNLKPFNAGFSKGRKFVRVYTDDGNQRMVWGFINLTHEKFREGDILKSAGWAAPALNVARGNIFDGFEINRRTVYGPGYCSGVIRGTKRDGSFV